MSRRLYQIASVLIASAGAIGCHDSTGPHNPEPARIQLISVTPGFASLSAIGDSIQLAAEAHNASGALVQVALSWTSSNPSAVTVSQSGLVKAIGKGEAEINASAEGVHGRAQIVVTGTAISTVVPSSGGTVTHPDGAQVVVPAGISSSPIAVRIEEASSPWPSLDAAGPAFRFSIQPTAPGGSFARSRATASVSAQSDSITLILPLSRPVATADEFAIPVRVGADEFTWYVWRFHAETGSTQLRAYVSPDPQLRDVTLEVTRIGTSNDCFDAYKLTRDTQGLNDGVPVVVVHGWQIGSDMITCQSWLAKWNATGFGINVFAALSAHEINKRAAYYRYTYPTYRPIDAGAQVLAKFLDDSFPNRTDVVIVAHSMGGLVARAAVELYGGWRHVSRVITLGTPHQGTPWAEPAKIPQGLVPWARTPGVLDMIPASGANFIARLREGSSPPRRSLYRALAGDVGESRCTDADCLKFIGLDIPLRAIGQPSDGLVPISSARWSETDLRGEFGATFSGYDHTQMFSGREALSTDPVLNRVAELVDQAVQRNLIRLVIKPQFASVKPGSTLRFVAIAVDANGDSTAVPASWRTFSTIIATIAADGTLTGVREGITPVVASFDTLTAVANIAVSSIPIDWRFTPSGTVTGTAIARSGQVLVLTGSPDASDSYLGSLSALDPTTGTVLWTRSGWQYTRSGPVVGSDGNIYVTGTNGFGFQEFVAAFDGVTGNPRWATGARSSEVGYFQTPVIGSAGNVYVPAVRAVFEIDALTGTPQAPFSHSTVGPLAAADQDGTLYLNVDDSVTAFTSAKARIWSQQVPGPFQPPVALGSAGALYASGTNGVVYSLNRGTGAVLWHSAASSAPVAGTFAITGDGTLVFTANGVFAFDAATGNPRWSYGTSRQFLSSIAAADGTVISLSVSPDSRLVALNGSSGAVRWIWAPQGVSLTGSPLLLPNGQLIVYGYGNVYALNTSLPGLAASPWPMPQRDLQRTSREK